MRDRTISRLLNHEAALLVRACRRKFAADRSSSWWLQTRAHPCQHILCGLERGYPIDLSDIEQLLGPGGT